MEDSWVTFTREYEGHPAVIMANNATREIVQHDQLTHLLQVHLPFKDPTPQGMPGPAEFGFLEAVDQVEDDHAERLGLFAAARVTGFGRRVLYYYTKDPANAEEFVAKLKQAVPFAIEHSVKEDPNADHVSEKLLPSDREQQVARSLTFCPHLAQSGDSLETPRPITHFAYFPDHEQGRAFARALDGRFKINSEGAVDGQANYGVEFEHHGPATPSALRPIFEELIDVAEQHGGEYDGWETFVVQEKKKGFLGLFKKK